MISFSAIGVGIVLFASTNIDDILLLAAFFADPRLTTRAVVAGQFAGIGALVAVSAAAALAAVVVPPAWIALLGIVPLLLGVRSLWQLLDKRDRDSEPGEVREEERFLERRVRSQALAIAGVTIANGGDNLGVYVPVFAADVRAIPIYTVIFAVMTALWCLAGRAAVDNRLFGQYLRRYGHVLLPFVLIGLGIMILADAAPLIR